MKRFWPYLVLPTIVLVITLIGYQLRESGPRGPAPGFARPIVAGAGAAEGDRIDLDSLRGRVVLLDFWASWCGPCRQSIPVLNRVQAELAGEPVTFVGVNVEANLPDGRLRTAHEAFGAQFPTVRDRPGDIQAAYGIDRLPTMVLIGPDGTLAGQVTGVPDEEALVQQIRDLLE